MSRCVQVKTESGEVLDIGIQQYTIGLYVCIYKKGRMVEQFGVDTTEEDFIESLNNDKSLILL